MVEFVKIHSVNPKVLEFRGKPLVLLCATEHYGSVMNRQFEFEAYLADAAEKKQTLTRLFILFRELQCGANPYSPCKPNTLDYVSPYRRTGPGRALDNMPKYDLDQWNPEFFTRLHDFVTLAGQNGIVVEVVFLSNTYNQSVWALNPLNHENNINNVERIGYSQYQTLKNRKLFEHQSALVRKITEELRGFDNVIYEICNEPGGSDPALPEGVATEEVNQWLKALVSVVRETEQDLPRKHLIAGQEAFAYALPEDKKPTGDVWQYSDKCFDEFDYDIVNAHPLSRMVLRGKTYDTGEFMWKEARLKGLREYCLALWKEKKPANLDEDNAASMFTEIEGWTIHRKRAWTTLFCGCHYDFIDFSIVNYREKGTEESQRCIRKWMRILSEYVHSIDLVKAEPLEGVVQGHLENTVVSVFGVKDQDFSIYIADGRELEEDQAGEEITGSLTFSVPEGMYEISHFSPTEGNYFHSVKERGGEVKLTIGPFVHDVAVRIKSIAR